MIVVVVLQCDGFTFFNILLYGRNNTVCGLSVDGTMASSSLLHDGFPPCDINRQQKKIRASKRQHKP